MSLIEQSTKMKIGGIETTELDGNFEYSVKTMRLLLEAMGTWPFKSMTYPKILRVFLIGAYWFLLMFYTIPFCLYTFMIVQDFKTRLRFIGPISFAFANIFKYVSVLLRESQLREFLDWMAADWRSARSQVENELMLESARSAKSFTMICIAWMYSGSMFYTSLGLVMDPIVVNNRTSRSLAYPGYFVFFDPYEHFRKVYTLHVMCGISQCTITCAVASIVIACVMHVCGQIAVTSWMLCNVSADSFDITAFGRIVERHLRAIAFAKKLEDYLNSICLVEMMCGCFNICMLGYYFITDKNENWIMPCTYCILIVSFTFNIFMFCYMGDQLTEKCDVSGDAAYAIDWYDFPAKDARNVLMVVASTQQPIVLTAGKMATLSMTCFSSVIKASFSYLNMLRTVTN